MKQRVLTILLSFCIPAVAGAIGVSASPPRLEVSGTVEKAIHSEIIVSNPSRDVAIFDVYPDDFESGIRITPASFVLESGDQKKVAVSVVSNVLGQFETNISVVARPLSETAFNAASGVKIPFRFEIVGSEARLALVSSAIPLGSTGIVFGYVLLVLLYAIFVRYAIIYVRKR